MNYNKNFHFTRYGSPHYIKFQTNFLFDRRSKKALESVEKCFVSDFDFDNNACVVFNLRFHSYIHLVFENSRCFAANAFLQSTWKRSSHLEVFHGDAVLINFTRGRRALSTLLGKFHVTGTQLYTITSVFNWFCEPFAFAKSIENTHYYIRLPLPKTDYVMEKQTYTRQANT